MKTQKRQIFLRCSCSFFPYWIGRKNVNLHPIDVSYDELKKYNDDKDFCPADLDNNDSRKHLTKLLYKYMKRVAEISNHNLIRNSDAYMASGGKGDQDNHFSWIDNSYKGGKKNSTKLLVFRIKKLCYLAISS